ncbi:MAG: hypothetical protein R2854_26755 [Caldilineaceae bacterium]
MAQHLVVASTDEGLAGFILVSKMDNPQVMPACMSAGVTRLPSSLSSS